MIRNLKLQILPNLNRFVRRNSTNNNFKSINEIDSTLRQNIKNIGAILGDRIRFHDQKVFDSVEDLRKLGREWRKFDESSDESFDKMVKTVKCLDAEKLLGISRSFANFLALSNTAENHHRIRRLKKSLIESNSPYGLWPKNDSCAGVIQNLVQNQSLSKDLVFDKLTKQQVEIVLTAHPTEVNRRTILRKHRRISEIFDFLDREDISDYERKNFNQQLRSEINSLWESDDLRRKKPTPVKEALTGIAIVETILWNSIPSFVRKLDDVSRSELQKPLPLDFAPIKLASWMGGDRDGNPNVTPEITLEVSFLSRWMAATLLKSDIEKLRASLSMKDCSREIRGVVGYEAREPYRDLLKIVESRLQATLDWISLNLNKDSSPISIENYQPKDSKYLPFKCSSELMDILKMIHASLLEQGLEEVANDLLVDIIRRLSAFGLALMPLDIRQESTRHNEALDTITRYLGLGSYLQWDESTRQNWLLAELSSRRPLLHQNLDYETLGFSPNVVDTLKTFDLIATIEEDSLGAYVISQCQNASDVLAVMLLQANAGVKNKLRVVPLFETLNDLERSADIIDSLFSMSVYRGMIHNKQEVMVGYSDSAKDAGRLAASWAQYNAQTSMIDIASKYGVELTFFHGKGGTVGRGGNPALFEAILAHPPGTINGRFRVTEQGEMITQNFGLESVAERTMDLFTAGVLQEGFLERPLVKPEWNETMTRLSDISCEIYRGVVRGEKRFVPYFRKATPEQELSGLNVGSRPAKRNPTGGVESLRAIPWVFAWTQTRLNLPTWLGVGEAFSLELKSNPDLLRQMYTGWPWFRTLVDLLEMILLKSELKIAENYDIQLVNDEQSLQLGRELRGKMQNTISSVLQVSGNQSLQVNNQILIKSMAVRNPYVDPLNIIQAEVLSRLRNRQFSSEEESKILQDTLLITINGIANGMRNSG